MKKNIFYYILGLIIGYSIFIPNIIKNNYIETLAQEAPETLLPPQREQFDTVENYRRALVKYSIRGNWATE